MSKPIASCPLTEPADPGSYLHLTSTYLEVLKKGKSKKYAITALMRLELNHRQLLGPLVGGGLLACLSFIMLFSVSKWAAPLLVLAIGSLGLVYYGLGGIDVLTLREDKIRYDIVLPKTTPALRGFAKLYNRLVPAVYSGVSRPFPVFYLPSATEGTPGGYLYLEMPADHFEKENFSRVDLLKLPAEINFTPDSGENYRAEISEVIPPDAYISPSENE